MNTSAQFITDFSVGRDQVMAFIDLEYRLRQH